MTFSEIFHGLLNLALLSQNKTLEIVLNKTTYIYSQILSKIGIDSNVLANIIGRIAMLQPNLQYYFSLVKYKNKRIYLNISGVPPLFHSGARAHEMIYFR